MAIANPPWQAPRIYGELKMLTVPTIQLRVLFVFLVLEHRRRETSTWPNTQLQPGLHSRLLRLSPIAKLLVV